PPATPTPGGCSAPPWSPCPGGRNPGRTRAARPRRPSRRGAPPATGSTWAAGTASAARTVRRPAGPAAVARRPITGEAAPPHRRHTDDRAERRTEERGTMKYRSDFEREVEVEEAWIPMRDGTRLHARAWLPADALDDPVPALLEYLPYRKGDWTAPRDAQRHPYYAGHGYASVRVDLRGSGDSEGVMRDEYTPQELQDALDVIDWLASRPW